MNISDYRKIYMIGIGGIGMSALARYFLAVGKDVAGYDRVSTPLTDELTEEGARIHFSDEANMVKQEYTNPGDTLVVFTPAVPSSHKELTYFRDGGFSVLKRSEVLGMLTKDKRCIAVAGTHGKTTISTLIAHLFQTAGIPCSAFLGGISKNFQTNALISKGDEWMVVEADEFDRSFLKLYPDKAVITSCDPDHLDIYGDASKLESSFRQFISQVKNGGEILIRKDVEHLATKRNAEGIYTYSLEPGAAFYTTGMKLTQGQYSFDLHTPSGILKGFKTVLPGLVNVENAVAAAAMGQLLGMEEKIITKAIGSYKGVKRRFDVRINREDMVYIDDYAHHPRELESFIRSVRELYPGRTITGIFQPHLYSRTRDFAEGFASSLSKLDELILLDIYPARELAIPGVTSEIIFKNVLLEKKILCTGKDLMEELKKRHPEILLTMGAGDIDRFVEPIIELFS
ncbi:MAG: UDP-N-acetylmuramate--alanine ligase [Bacteroides sp. SM23_62_1]|nr:MAG: UDP-N-acetylmuramate--alanine ligase [Bacteroides sp. SM23_62_1]